MVIHIPDVFLQKIVDQKEKVHILKLLFYLFENNVHHLLLTEKENLQLYQCRELSMYREYVIKKAVRDSIRRVKSRYIVQLYPDEESLRAVVERIKNRHLDARIRTVLPGARYVVTYRRNTYDLIGYDLIKTFVGSPLKILVENIRSDKLFLQTVLKFVGQLNPDELFIEYLHGGGSTLIQVAEEYAGKARVFCLIDGDEVSPGEYVSPDKKLFKQNVIQTCKKYGYQYHVLSKREIENYIPDEALERMGFRRQRHLYFRLPEQHKDYFDMKEGLSPAELKFKIWRELNAVSPEIAAAGKNTKRHKLEGFGRTVYLAFQHVASKEELERRDRRGELQHLVRKILDIV